MSTDFYEALDRARRDPASATPELAKLAERLKPGGRLHITPGDQPATPEEIARQINLALDEFGGLGDRCSFCGCEPDDMAGCALSCCPRAEQA